jgi:hypothetical protein
MLRIFIGTDKRQSIAPQVLAHSIYRRASKPVSITPLVIEQLPVKKMGLTEFSITRYCVPYLCGFEGRALFLDADMLCLADISELEDVQLNDAVTVVKNERRFEWPSLMLFDNALCKILTPQYIESQKPWSLQWAESVGELDAAWNHIVPYDKPRKDAKIVHHSAGVPIWPETWNAEYAEEWREEAKRSMSSVSFQELMGTSVHNRPEVLEAMK